MNGPWRLARCATEGCPAVWGGYAKFGGPSERQVKSWTCGACGVETKGGPPPGIEIKDAYAPGRAAPPVLTRAEALELKLAAEEALAEALGDDSWTIPIRLDQ